MTLNRLRWIASTAATLSLAPTVAAAQAATEDSVAVGDSVAVADALVPERFGDGPFEEMSALLEVTILNIDVLTLTVRVPAEVATRLSAVVSGEEYSNALADSVAAVVLEADEMWARQVFERNVGFGRFLGGMRESSEKAVEAGLISAEYHQTFSDSLPVWFDFLEDEGPRDGDQVLFWVRGDTVRTMYRSFGGEMLMDRRGASAEGRRSSVPSFFVRGSRFRKRLVESLLDRNGG